MYENVLFQTLRGRGAENEPPYAIHPLEKNHQFPY
jgi:hypothetical protein